MTELPTPINVRALKETITRLSCHLIKIINADILYLIYPIKKSYITEIYIYLLRGEVIVIFFVLHYYLCYYHYILLAVF